MISLISKSIKFRSQLDSHVVYFGRKIIDMDNEFEILSYLETEIDDVCITMFSSEAKIIYFVYTRL